MYNDKYSILKNFFGYSSFKDGQEEIIDNILHGNSILAILPTGAGKSLTYQIPAIISNNFSIVITPLISIMQDQVEKLNSISNISAFINSSISYEEINLIYNRILNGEIKLLYISPERLENKNFLSFVNRTNPDYLFIDEAHCVSQWGNSFRPSYLKIKNFIQNNNFKAIAAFTATAADNVVNDIIKYLGLENVKIIKTGFYRENLSIHIFKESNKKEKLIEILNNVEFPGIIYVSTRKLAESLSFFLNQLGFENEFYHAGMNSKIRKRIQQQFLLGKLNLMVATNAFGMGIDKKDIRFVIHYNPPSNFEAFYQEIGRAGRDGKISYAYLLYNSEDDKLNEFLIDSNYPEENAIYKFYDFIFDNANIGINSFSNKLLSFSLKNIQQYFHREITDNYVEMLLLWFEKYSYLIKINKSNDIFIKFTLTPDELKKVIKETQDEIKKIILSNLVSFYNYSIFNEFVNLNVNKFCTLLNIDDNMIIEYLNKLENSSILEINKITNDFNYILLKSREREPNLYPIIKNVKELRQRANENYQKFKEFIYTSNCRMETIVNFFGERNITKCGICDNCMNKNLGDNLKYLKFLIHKTIEIEPTINDTEIVKILKGYSENIFSPTFSLGQSYSEEIILDTLKSLSDKRQNIIKKNIIYKKEDIQLYEKLKEVRAKVAEKYLQEENKICNDKVLIDIVLKKPRNIFELLSIKGFDKNKFNKFGEEILNIINNYNCN
jgi:ATP-dependent DNA helicase RecQ